MSRTGFQYALAALSAVVASEEFDRGALGSIVAGLNAAANTGRELSDLEQLALDNLMGQLVPQEETAEVPEEQPPASETAQETAGDAPASQVSVTPDVGEPTPAGPVAEEATPEVTGEQDTAVHEELFQPQSHDEDDGA